MQGQLGPCRPSRYSNEQDKVPALMGLVGEMDSKQTQYCQNGLSGKAKKYFQVRGIRNAR